MRTNVRCCSSTQTLCCEIGTRDLHEDFGEILDGLDTSNFDASLPQYLTDNRRALGKFKSETGSVAPKEVVGLRAKMYSLNVPGDPRRSFKKAKGIQKHYVKKEVNHRQFLDVLRRDRKDTRSEFRNFKSTNHVINTLEINKLCLCAFDDKRYILNDGIRTLASGHYLLRKASCAPPMGTP